MNTTLTLWQISQEQQQINALLEESGGELTEEILERLQNNEASFVAKSENYLYSIRRYKSIETSVDAEIERLQAIKKTCKKTQESLKKVLDIAMQQFSLDKLDLGEAGKVSYRRSEAVIVDDVNELDRAFCKVKLEADKTAIKEAIKRGEEVKGAYMEIRNNLTIK